MATETKALGFQCRELLLAVRFENITEICINVKVHNMPRLTRYYRGVLDYKGNIIPAVRLYEGQSGEEVPVVLIARSSLGPFGICLDQEPFIIGLKQDWEPVPEEQQLEKPWKAHRIYREEKKIFLLDLEKSAENLAVYDI